MYIKSNSRSIGISKIILYKKFHLYFNLYYYEISNKNGKIKQKKIKGFWEVFVTTIDDYMYLKPVCLGRAIKMFETMGLGHMPYSNSDQPYSVPYGDTVCMSSFYRPRGHMSHSSTPAISLWFIPCHHSRGSQEQAQKIEDEQNRGIAISRASN